MSFFLLNNVLELVRRNSSPWKRTGYAALDVPVFVETDRLSRRDRNDA